MMITLIYYRAPFTAGKLTFPGLVIVIKSDSHHALSCASS